MPGPLAARIKDVLVPLETSLPRFLMCRGSQGLQQHLPQGRGVWPVVGSDDQSLAAHLRANWS